MGGRPRGRRGGELGRRGNGLATNCTITTFRKRKNHSVLFLHTICFPLLPPTLQFRGREERPLLGGCPAGGSGLGTESGERKATAARGESQIQGSGGRTTGPPPCPDPLALPRRWRPLTMVLQQPLVTPRPPEALSRGE